MEVSPGSVVTIKEHILPNTLSLVLSSLLQGSAMVACLNFFRKLVQLGLPGLDFGNIFRVRWNIMLFIATFSFWHSYSLACLCPSLPPTPICCLYCTCPLDYETSPSLHVCCLSSSSPPPAIFHSFFLSDADRVCVQSSSPASATDNNTSTGGCGLCHVTYINIDNLIDFPGIQEHI